MEISYIVKGLIWGLSVFVVSITMKVWLDRVFRN